MAKVKKLVKGMVKRAIALGGTCTGEHGVGIGKREYLYEELGYGTVELMKKIKRTIDPLNLFNPGKVGRRLSWSFFLLNLRRCTRIRHRETIRGVHYDDRLRLYPRSVLLVYRIWTATRCTNNQRF